MPPDQHNDSSQDNIKLWSLLLEGFAEAFSLCLAPKLHPDKCSHSLNTSLKSVSNVGVAGWKRRQQLSDLGTWTWCGCGWLSLHYARSLYKKGHRQMAMEIMNKRRLNTNPLAPCQEWQPIHYVYLDHQTREWKTSIPLSIWSCEPVLSLILQ